jgi:hypothetical protein
MFTCAFGIAYAEARAAEGIGIGRFAGRTVHQYEHEYVCEIVRTSGGKCSRQMTTLWHSPRSEGVQQLCREQSRRLLISRGSCRDLPLAKSAPGVACTSR